MEINFENDVFEVDCIVQFDDIPYSKSLNCGCGYADITNTLSYGIVGYVDTKHGYMVVFSCPKCFEKYRHHIGTKGRYDINEFKNELGLILHLQKYLYTK